MKTISVIGSSLDYSNRLLLHKLCQLDEEVNVIIYDVNATSAHGRLGSKMVLELQLLYPDLNILHTTDIKEATLVDVMVFWGFTFPDMYNAAYTDFFTGTFKQAMELHMADEVDFKPHILFLKGFSSGLKAATILGSEIPDVKALIWVLSAASDRMGSKVYPRVDGSFHEMEPVSNHLQALIHGTQKLDGGFLDVDVIITCIKVLIFDNRSPREMFDYVGVFPDKDDQAEWRVGGKVCLFLPPKGETKYKDDLIEITKKDEADMIDFFKM